MEYAVPINEYHDLYNQVIIYLFVKNRMRFVALYNVWLLDKINYWYNLIPIKCLLYVNNLKTKRDYHIENIKYSDELLPQTGILPLLMSMQN